MAGEASPGKVQLEQDDHYVDKVKRITALKVIEKEETYSQAIFNMSRSSDQYAKAFKAKHAI